MRSTQALVALTLIALQLASASRAHHGFFQALSVEQKEQVSKILDGGLTKAEIREQLRHWVSSQPKETQEAFQAAEKSQQEFRTKMMNHHQNMLKQVSEPARQLHDQIRAIYEDQKLTKKETCEQVQALIKSTTAQVKQELKLKEMPCED